MGFGSYSFSTLQAIQGIAFRTLKKFTPAQIVDTGLKVSRLLADYKKGHPDKLPKKASGGLLNFGTFIDVDDFELALHLVNTNDPAMAKIVKGAKGLPVLTAYLSVLTNGAELPPEHLLESALPFAIASLSLEGEIASVWNQSLQTEIAQLAQLASKGLKFKGGKPKGSFGPVASAVRKRLLENSDESPDEIWQALFLKPPKGMTFYGDDKDRNERRIESESRKEPSKKHKAEPSMWGGLGDKTQAGKQLVIVSTGWAQFRAIVIEPREDLENCTESRTRAGRLLYCVPCSKRHRNNPANLGQRSNN